jgi:hypothetical protein
MSNSNNISESIHIIRNKNKIAGNKNKIVRDRNKIVRGFQANLRLALFGNRGNDLNGAEPRPTAGIPAPFTVETDRFSFA